MSQWGEGFGAQPNQFECPDFFPLAVDGDPANKKYVMIVNVNPGFVFGGSATEYFVGEFDGKEFKCDSKPTTVKWLDWGKDHYATVTFSNLGDRIVAVPWMSNWQYANFTPIRQYRGANALPRELKLFSNHGETYVSANVVEEARALRKETKLLGDITADNANPYVQRNLFDKAERRLRGRGRRDAEGRRRGGHFPLQRQRGAHGSLSRPRRTSASSWTAQRVALPTSAVRWNSRISRSAPWQQDR